MIRCMIDSDQLANVRPRAAIGATYADLLTAAQLAALESTWPAVMLFDRGLGDPLGKASTADVERGALRVDQVRAKLEGWQHDGRPYTAVYASRDTMPAVDAACHGLTYYRIYATLDGTAFINGRTPGLTPAGIQVLGSANLGFHADLSLVFEDSYFPPPATANLRGLARHIRDQIDAISTAADHGLADVVDLLAALA